MRYENQAVVLGISIDKDERAYKAFLKHFNIGFETTRDPDKKISLK